MYGSATVNTMWSFLFYLMFKFKSGRQRSRVRYCVWVVTPPTARNAHSRYTILLARSRNELRASGACSLCYIASKPNSSRPRRCSRSLKGGTAGSQHGKLNTAVFKTAVVILLPSLGVFVWGGGGGVNLPGRLRRNPRSRYV